MKAIAALCLLGFAGCSLSLKTGSCPPTLPVNICSSRCSSTAPCGSPQLCCPTSCGGSMCVDPVTQRRFINLVKPGKCPDTPGGVWVCSHTCTSDSDCPRKLKCCANRCGAKVCTRAEFPIPSTPPVVNSNNPAVNGLPVVYPSNNPEVNINIRPVGYPNSQPGVNSNSQPYDHSQPETNANSQPDEHAVREAGITPNRKPVENTNNQPEVHHNNSPSTTNNHLEIHDRLQPERANSRPGMSNNLPEISFSRSNLSNDPDVNPSNDPGKLTGSELEERMNRQPEVTIQPEDSRRQPSEQP